MTADRPVFAACLLAASMFLMSFVDNLVRVVSDDITVWQFHLLRAMFALPMVGMAAWMIRGQTLRQNRPLWVSARATLMAISMLFFFASIPMMPMAQATAGLFSAPLFVLAFSALFLGERVGWRRICAVLVGFAGYAGGVIITRQKCRDESPLALLFANFSAFGLMGGLGALAMTAYNPSEAQNLAAPFIFSTWSAPPWETVAMMGGLAIGAVLGVGGLTRAYQLADSSFLTLFDYTHVLGASLFAYILWSEVPPPEAIVGVIMIVGAGIYIAIRGRKV